MSKSEIKQKYDEDATRLHRKSLLTSSTYKVGPPSRANGSATQDTREDKVQGPPVIRPEKDGGGGGSPRVGRTWTESSPGASRGGVMAKPPDHLPYMLLVGTDLH